MNDGYEVVAHRGPGRHRDRNRLFLPDAGKHVNREAHTAQELIHVWSSDWRDFQQKGKVVENEKDRITVRIEEEDHTKSEAGLPPTDESAGKPNTKVVFIRDQELASNCYYRGYHDGANLAYSIILIWTAFVAVLVFLNRAPK
jgi:hypothetical protein